LYAPENFVENPDKLGFIMRSLNIKPTLTELKEYFVKYGKEGHIDFADFLDILHFHLQTEEAAKEILKAFKTYDTRNTGYISVKDLRFLLTMTGEKLTNKDVDMILRESNSKDDKVNYERLIQTLAKPIAY
jgi:Ca2+-binding EF-hand superfamily protein